ncbi:CU044_5270 family protein [Sinosporangium siamense]|uniref:CU044_5270 family protein n=1 Tax=Sinosporangium siamense TaxID=1367973 RepID=A0A919RDU8_9ACTN|nr:CU044_5270 family protein [Sinosporangium siamense]GII92076.1 hypothetical protein Ssi02_23070 [Sinosporangium siamense]
MDEMDAVRSLWAGTPEGSAKDLATARASLLRTCQSTPERQEQPRPSPRRRLFGRMWRRGLPRLATAAGLAGAVAAAVLVHQGNLMGPATPANAKELFALAAAATEGQPDLRPRPDQYVRTSSLVAAGLMMRRSDGQWAEALQVRREERWVPAEAGLPMLQREETLSTSPADKDRPLPAHITKALSKREGVVEDILYSTSCKDAPDATLSFLRLHTWPTEVEALSQRVRAVAARRPSPAHTRLWATLSELIRLSAARPSLTGALYQVAAGVDGVTLVRDAVDVAGRVGVAAAFDDGEGTRYELIFDRETYRYLGEREVPTGDRAPRGPAREVPRTQSPSGSAVMGVEVVDRLPKLSADASRMTIPC